MKFLSLIGKKLKDDDVLEFLEDFDVPVTYDFDRTHENIPDKYWGEAKQEGILLGFDENQVLCTIFLYLIEKEGFTPIMLSRIEDIRLFVSVEEIKTYAATSGAKFLQGNGSVGGGLKTTWARLDGTITLIHYEFIGNQLARITVMKSE
jgi:hypothetical protein